MRLNVTRSLLLRHWLLLLLVLTATSGPLLAQEGVDVAGAADVTFVKRYTDSYITHYTQRPDGDYRLLLGELKKVNGLWSAERESLLRGRLTRVTYRIPDFHTTSRVMEFLEENLQSYAPKKLFECNSRECGSSNQWANGVFAVKQLYGPDRNQRYRVWQIEENAKTYYLAAYAIERGNKRLYLHIDSFEDSGEAGSDVASQQPAPIVILLSELASQRQRALLFKVKATVESREGLKAYVVGHSYQSADVDKATALSLSYAQKVLSQLLSMGVAQDRLSAHGVGPLAPGSANDVDRVEVIFY